MVYMKYTSWKKWILAGAITILGASNYRNISLYTMLCLTI